MGGRSTGAAIFSCFPVLSTPGAAFRGRAGPQPAEFRRRGTTGREKIFKNRRSFRKGRGKTRALGTIHLTGGHRPPVVWREGDFFLAPHVHAVIGNLARAGFGASGLSGRPLTPGTQLFPSARRDRPPQVALMTEIARGFGPAPGSSAYPRKRRTPAVLS